MKELLQYHILYKQVGASVTCNVKSRLKESQVKDLWQLCNVANTAKSEIRKHQIQFVTRWDVKIWITQCVSLCTSDEICLNMRDDYFHCATVNKDIKVSSQKNGASTDAQWDLKCFSSFAEEQLEWGCSETDEYMSNRQVSG